MTLSQILYVEDDADIRTICGMVLKSLYGVTLEVYCSCEEAITRSEAFAPQLVLLDVMMPGMDGPETLAALRRLPGLEKTPVIFMTAKVQAQEVEAYLRLGALGVIAKPFDPMSLSDQLRQLWNKSQEPN